MTEKINPETQFIIKIYTFEYYVKFSFWVSVVCKFSVSVATESNNHLPFTKIYLKKSEHILEYSEKWIYISIVNLYGRANLPISRILIFACILQTFLMTGVMIHHKKLGLLLNASIDWR